MQQQVPHRVVVITNSEPAPVTVPFSSPAASRTARAAGISRHIRLQRQAACFRSLGLTEMLVGGTLVALGLTGLIQARYEILAEGTGLFTGVMYFVTGLTGFLAGQRLNSRCLVACLILGIFTSLISFVGLCVASREINYNRRNYHCSTVGTPFRDCAAYKPAYYFQIARGGIVVCCSLVMFILTLVHSGYSCQVLCNCCGFTLGPTEAARLAEHQLIQVPFMIPGTGPVVYQPSVQPSAPLPSPPPGVLMDDRPPAYSALFGGGKNEIEATYTYSS